MIAAALEHLCREGAWTIGEVAVSGDAHTGYELVHRADAALAPDLPALRALDSPESVRDLARLDAAGDYRPLKGAPNLPRGWRFRTRSTEALRQALDFLYPAAISAWLAWREDRLRVTDLRETLGRQTGMYRVTRKISDDAADEMVASFCRSDGGCLRTILWRIAPDRAIQSLPATKFDPAVDQAGPGETQRHVPVLCPEGCNLLVARAREVVKRAAP